MNESNSKPRNPEEPKTYVEDVNIAWDMAIAEKPIRDKKLALIEQRKQEFTNRLTEIKKVAANGEEVLNDIKPNVDETLYANDGVVQTGGYVDQIGKPISTDPVETAKIATVLIGQDNIRAHRVLTSGQADMAHPQSDEIDKFKKDLKDDYSSEHWDDIGPSGSAVARIAIRKAELLNDRLNEPVIDSSRSVASDKASDEVGHRAQEDKKKRDEILGL